MRQFEATCFAVSWPCCWKQELESRMKQADLEWEWKEVIRGLDALNQVEANFQGDAFLFRSQLTAHAFASGACYRRGEYRRLYGSFNDSVQAEKCSAKALLPLGKSFNANNLIFRTVERRLE
jgi:hypothetical protein